ncbi:MAG: GntR family transcriptional regulator [Desulfuromonas sp.]|nr:MAG: GntR family transcriptional regulator [Desulfuromonas sp.]
MPIERSTYKDHAIKYIYDGMRENRFRPGEKILESHLALELGISRAPIREALADLVRSGLLEYRPQVGNFVADLSPEEIIDSYVARGVLEGYAVAQGIDNFSEEDFRRLEQMAETMETYARAGKRKALIDIGQSFHEELFSHCTNDQVVLFTRQLSLKLHLLFYKHWAKVYSPEEIRDRHLAIIDVLRKQDPVKVEMLIREHYIDTGRKVVERESRED